MHMKPALGALPFLLMLATGNTALADETAPMIERALLVEWMVANCDHAAIPAMTAGAAMMVISGYADQTGVPVIREKIRDGMATHYPDIEAGCAALFTSMGVKPPGKPHGT